MKDTFDREIRYLRLSVTDRCNYRCIYCMPESGVCKKEHRDILSIEEMIAIVRAAHTLGVNKIRLTGGEPLVRKGILRLCRSIKEIDSKIELGLTTNGSLLAPIAKELKAAGVDRLNISLDSMDPTTFRQITRRGNLQDVLDGIRAAQEAGFENIKINTVLLKGVNDREIADWIRLTREHPVHVRFIELMPLGVAKEWEQSRFVTTDTVNKLLPADAVPTIDGVAKVYHLPGHTGTVGLIRPMSHSFCPTCNKIRVTADGKLKPCLHSHEEIDLRGLCGEELIKAIREGVRLKPEHHRFNQTSTGTERFMNEIGG